MTSYSARVPTANGSRYLQQLCKHWSHRFDVDFTSDRGVVDAGFGKLMLVASDDSLTVSCDLAEGADASKMQQVVADHINRFAFREGELEFDWKAGRVA
ncbi:MAG: DUF2218 domain-containing protein [Novosphingobium sp.]|nr:DUF2218 domain-containing protein [Novosphingobium sp.]